VPPNRHHRDRESKAAEIVIAASALFAEAGYENTSMVSVARAAGVTTTTIYWYFADKEALLIAVLDHLLREMLDGLETQADQAWTDQLLWVVERLREQSRLVTSVHVLSTTSEAVARWHGEFHELTDALLADGIRQSGAPESQVEARARLGVFAVEGLLMHALPRDEQRAVLEVLVAGR
jgi:AcrR family transcriptional regulator